MKNDHNSSLKEYARLFILSKGIEVSTVYASDGERQRQIAIMTHKFFFSLLTGKTSPNECSGFDTKQSDGDVSCDAGALGNANHLFIAITSRSTLAWKGCT